MTRGKNIEVNYLFFQCLVYCFEILEKTAFFKKFNCQFQNLRLGVCLAMCLKFPEFEAGCAYKLVAYKKKCI